MQRCLVVLLSFFLTTQVNALTKIACIGDSLTFGSGTVITAAEQGKSYPGQLQLLLGSDYEVKNFGAPGHTAIKNGDLSYWKSEQYNKAIAFHPDMVVIQLGTNDTRSQNRAELNNFSHDYRDLVEVFQRAGARVYVSLPPPLLKEGMYETSSAILENTIIPSIQTIAKDLNLTVIDNHTALNDSSYYKLWWGMDYIHLNATGYKRMALTVYQILAPALQINQCTLLLNQYRVLPGIYWGDAKDSQLRNHIAQQCMQSAALPRSLCYVAQPYLTAFDWRARQAAHNYWGTNDCDRASALMNNVSNI